MNNTRRNTALALAGLVALGLGSVSQHAAAEEQKMEKCFGVAKAGKNDCQTATSACAGTSTQDGQKDAWLLVPTGTCERLVGGNLKSEA